MILEPIFIKSRDSFQRDPRLLCNGQVRLRWVEGYEQGWPGIWTMQWMKNHLPQAEKMFSESDVDFVQLYDGLNTSKTAKWLFHASSETAVLESSVASATSQKRRYSTHTPPAWFGNTGWGPADGVSSKGVYPLCSGHFYSHDGVVWSREFLNFIKIQFINFPFC